MGGGFSLHGLPQEELEGLFKIGFERVYEDELCLKVCRPLCAFVEFFFVCVEGMGALFKRGGPCEGL